MVVQSVSNVEDLQSDGNREVVVVHFYADWSEECKHIDKITEALSIDPEFNHISFKKCAAENFPSISTRFNITAVPTVVFLQNGQKVDELTGADPVLLNSKLQQFAKKGTADNALTSFLLSNLVIAFVTEDSASNKELISILEECKIKFKTHDLLADNAMKQKLELFSGCVSFPQLYIKGNFVGDLVSVKQLKSSGELISWYKAAKKNMDRNQVHKLRSLINQSDIMVFMKGDRDTPRCGFSRQLMEILKETSLPFETFDILTDEEVRQGLKTYSVWPTYPQIYVKGKLVGGLDVIKMLAQEGELLSTLRGEAVQEEDSD